MTMLMMDDLRRVILMMPKELRTRMKEHKLFLGGGAIRAIISGEEISDWDLFGHDAAFLKTIAQAMLGARGSGSRIYSTKYAHTLLGQGRKPIQFITRWTYDDPHKLMMDFDFTICSAVIWWNQKEQLWEGHCHGNFYADLAARRLSYMCPAREEDAGGSMLRVVKFLRRGYNISPESLARVMSRITEKMRESPTINEPGGHFRVITGLLREVDPLTVIDGLEARDSVADPLFATNDLENDHEG